MDDLLKAMVLQKLDRPEEAISTLKRAQSYIEQRTPLDPSQPTPIRSLHWLQCQVLNRQAMTLIEPSTATHLSLHELHPAASPQGMELILRHHTRAALTESPSASANVESWLGHARMLTALGEFQRAAAGFGKVLEMLPQRQIANSPRKLICLEIARRAELFAPLIDLRPNDIDLRFAHARLHSLRNDWAEAQTEYARVIDTHPRNTEEWCEYACLSLLNSDIQQYRQICQQLSESQGMTTDRRTAFFLTRAGVLEPTSGITPDQLIAWGMLATENDRSPWRLTALAMSHYRAGQFSLAAEVLKEAQAQSWANEGKAQIQLVLALTSHQLGRHDAADQLLEEAIQYIEEQQTPAGASVPAAVFPVDWMTLHVLRREAETLLRP